MDVQQCLAQAKQAEQQKQWSQAAELYTKVLEVLPDHQSAKEQLAWCLSRAKEYSQAISVLQDLAQRQPEVAKWPYMIGYQHHEQQRWREAIEWYERALAMNPDYIVVLYRKGYAHSQLKQVGEALRAFERCRTLWHALPEGPLKERDKGNCAKAAYHQAKVLIENPAKLSAGAIEAAVPLLKEAIQLDPDDHNKHYLLGKAYLEIGQPERSLSAFQEANRLKSNQDYILARWAMALDRLGRLEDAEKLYQCIPPRQRKGYILRNLGILYYRMNNYEQAIATLRQAVRKDARNHNGHYYLGLCYSATEKWGLAAKELREAIRLRQKHYGRPFPDAQGSLDELLAQHPEATTDSLKSGRQRGTVIKYFDDRGYGFIESDTGGETFFHIKDCQSGESMERGARVEFEAKMSDKGLRAIRVTRISTSKNT